MNEKEAALLKAAHKSLAHHFKKSAAHHEKMAAHHLAMHEAHKAHAEHYEKCMGKAEDPQHESHKASHHFHKTMAGHHEKCHKAHAAHAEHYHQMHDAHESGDAEKIAKLAGVEMPELTPAPAAAAAAASTQPPAAAPASAPATEGQDVLKAMEKTIGDRLEKAINEAVERVTNSSEFSKALDEKLTAKMLEKLGGGNVPTNISSVPRPGDNKQPVASVAKVSGEGSIVINHDGLNPELAHLISD